MKNLVGITTVEQGKLIRFKSSSDVYRVLETGYFITVKNMYSDKVSTIKHYTNKGSKSLERTVEVVQFY
jgi:hypothetical protein